MEASTSTVLLAVFVAALVAILAFQWRVRPDATLVDSQNRALQDRDSEIRALKTELRMDYDDAKKREIDMQLQIDKLLLSVVDLTAKLVQSDARITLLEAQIRSTGGKPITERA